MKYKIGDKVRIKSLDWYNENKDENGSVLCNYNYYFTRLMTKYCGEVMTVKDIINVPLCRCYMFEEDEFMCHFTDDMLEGLVEETKAEPKFKVGDSVEVLKSGNTYTISQVKFNGKEFVYTLSNNGSTVSCFSEEEIEFTEEDKYWCDIMSESDPATYVLPQGYQFVDENGNVINAMKIVLEKKKKEVTYPKTYEECCKVVRYNPHRIDDMGETICGYKSKLLRVFQMLLVCRDAYWKIAGEEMGLGKPWEPDWLDDDTKKYVITSSKVFETFGGLGYINYILTFPTEELRDAFYENFKELIESCKELL